MMCPTGHNQTLLDYDEDNKMMMTNACDCVWNSTSDSFRWISELKLKLYSNFKKCSKYFSNVYMFNFLIISINFQVFNIFATLQSWRNIMNQWFIKYLNKSKCHKLVYWQDFSNPIYCTDLKFCWPQTSLFWYPFAVLAV